MKLLHGAMALIGLFVAVIACAVVSAGMAESRARPLGPGAFLSVTVAMEDFAACEDAAPDLAIALSSTSGRPVRVDCFRRISHHPAPEQPGLPIPGPADAGGGSLTSPRVPLPASESSGAGDV